MSGAETRQRDGRRSERESREEETERSDEWCGVRRVEISFVWSADGSKIVHDFYSVILVDDFWSHFLCVTYAYILCISL